jgi:hypothetical protein
MFAFYLILILYKFCFISFFVMTIYFACVIIKLDGYISSKDYFGSITSIYLPVSCLFIIFLITRFMSTGNYSRTPQAQHYTVHHVDPTRIYNQQQLEKVSVATHPPSSTNSPVSLIYHPDLKRSLLCLNKTSNP